VLFCVDCNQFGEGHNKCAYYTLSKEEMNLVVDRKPINIEAVKKRNSDKKKKAKKDDPLTEIERAVMEIEEAVASTETQHADNISFDDDFQETREVVDWPEGRNGHLSDASSPTLTSTPHISGQYCGLPYDPRQEAAPCNSRVAMTNLVGKVGVQQKLTREAQEWESVMEAKAKRLEAELEKEKDRNALLEKKLKEVEMLLAKEEKEKKEAKEELEFERSEMEKAIDVLKGEFQRKLDIAEKKKEKERWWLLHVKCASRGITDRHWEKLSDLESSTFCFANADKKTHCHHIKIRTYSEFAVYLQNVKFSSKSLDFIQFNLIK